MEEGLIVEVATIQDKDVHVGSSVQHTPPKRKLSLDGTSAPPAKKAKHNEDNNVVTVPGTLSVIIPPTIPALLTVFTPLPTVTVPATGPIEHSEEEDHKKEGIHQPSCCYTYRAEGSPQEVISANFLFTNWFLNRAHSRIDYEETMTIALNHIYKLLHQLSDILDSPAEESCPENFRIVKVIKALDACTTLISDFNQLYHLQGNEMESCSSCGHPLLVKLLLKLLRRLLPYNSYNIFNKENIEERNNEQTGKPLEPFKYESCFLLGLLSRNENGRDVIIREDGIPYIVQQLRLSTDCILTMRYCCYALGNLATSISVAEAPEFQRFVIRENLIPFLFSMLKKNIECWQLAQQVFFAIGNLAYVSDFEELILSCDGVSLATHFLTNYSPEQWGMATDTVFFLKNVAFGEPGRVAILKGNIIDLVLRLLWLSPTCSELVELSANLLFDLSFSGATAELTKSPEPVQFLMKLLEIHADAPPVAKELLRTLARIYTCAESAVQIMMIREQLIERILPFFQLHDSDEDFQEGLDHVCTRISHVPVPAHEYAPTEAPSLQELCARSVLDHNLSDQIPSHMNYLVAGGKRCVGCCKHFLDYKCELIVSQKHAAWDYKELPHILYFCSKKCLETYKEQNVQPSQVVPEVPEDTIDVLLEPILL